MRNLKNKLERIYRKAARTLVERGVEGPSPAKAPSEPAQAASAEKGALGAPVEPAGDLGNASGDPPAPQTPPQSPQGPSGSKLEDFIAQEVARSEQVGLAF